MQFSNLSIYILCIKSINRILVAYNYKKYSSVLLEEMSALIDMPSLQIYGDAKKEVTQLLDSMRGYTDKKNLEKLLSIADAVSKIDPFNCEIIKLFKRIIAGNNQFQRQLKASYDHFQNMAQKHHDDYTHTINVFKTDAEKHQHILYKTNLKLWCHFHVNYQNLLIVIFWIITNEMKILNYQKAYFWCKKGLEMSKDYFLFRYTKAVLDIKFGTYEETIEDLQFVLRERPDLLEYYRRIINTFFQAEQTLKASKYIKRLKWMSPCHDLAHEYFLELIKQKGSKKYHKAMLKRLLQSDSVNSQFWTKIGQHYLDIQCQIAIACFSKAIKLSPTNPFAHLRFFEIKLKIGVPAEYVIAELQNVIKTCTHQQSLLNYLTAIYYLQNRFQQAMRNAYMVVKKYPDNPVANAIMAKMILNIDRAKALQYFQKAIKTQHISLLKGAWTTFLLAVINQLNEAECLKYATQFQQKRPTDRDIQIRVRIGIYLMRYFNKQKDMLSLAALFFEQALERRAHTHKVLLYLAAVSIKLNKLQRSVQALKIFVQSIESKLKVNKEVIEVNSQDHLTTIFKQLYRILQLGYSDVIFFYMIAYILELIEIRGQYQISVFCLEVIQYKDLLNLVNNEKRMQLIKQLEQQAQHLLFKHFQSSLKKAVKRVDYQDSQKIGQKLFSHLLKYLRFKPVNIFLLVSMRLSLFQEKIFQAKEQQLNKFKDICVFPQIQALFNMLVFFDTESLSDRSDELLVTLIEEILRQPTTAMKKQHLQLIIRSAIEYLARIKCNYIQAKLSCHFSFDMQRDYCPVFRGTLLRFLMDQKQEFPSNVLKHYCSPTTNKVKTKIPFQYLYKQRRQNKKHGKTKKVRSKVSKNNFVKEGSNLLNVRSQFQIFQVTRPREILQTETQDVYFQPLLQQMYLRLNYITCNDSKPGNESSFDDRQFTEQLNKKNRKTAQLQKFTIENIKYIQEETKKIQLQNSFQSLNSMLQRLFVFGKCHSNHFLGQTLAFLIESQPSVINIEQNIILNEIKPSIFDQRQTMPTQFARLEKIIKALKTFINSPVSSTYFKKKPSGFIQSTISISGQQTSISLSGSIQSPFSSIQNAQNFEQTSQVKVQDTKLILYVQNEKALAQIQQSSSKTDSLIDDQLRLYNSGQKVSSQGHCTFTNNSNEYFLINFDKLKTTKILLEESKAIEEKYIQLQFKNQVNLARYLSSKKRVFKYIAKHYFDENKLVRNQSTNRYLAYELKMEEGDNRTKNEHQLWAEGKQCVLHWIICFIRQIIQLQETGIFYLDFAIRNSVKIKTAKYFFKIIDFDYAFKVEIAGTEAHRNLFQHTKTILKFWLSAENQFSKNSFIEDYLLKTKLIRGDTEDSVVPLQAMFTIKNSQESEDKKVQQMLELMERYSLLHHRDQFRSIIDSIFVAKQCNLDKSIVEQIRGKASSIKAESKEQNIEGYKEVLKILKDLCRQCPQVNCICRD